MKHVLTGAAAAAMCAGTALAGGVERSTQSVSILFEKDTYVELSFSTFNPDVSGTVGGGAVASGDMSPRYNNYSLAFKQALTDRIDLAVILDQAIGADVSYPVGTGYPAQGSTADLSNTSVTALLRYKLENNFSLIGGLRSMTTQGEASLPFLAYTLDTSTETDFGYVVGVAWEKPEIAARVALTYNSAITHDFDAYENGGAVPTRFSTEIPKSVNLEFQTGVAADTLLFGSIRWADWTSFDIDPVGYPAADPLVFYTNDVITYTLGLGRKFNETWSGAVVLGYEKTEGDLTGNLGPKDGYKSIGLAATYTKDRIKITGGVRYVDIGNATTRVLNGDFRDNSGWGVGIRVGYQF